jgi:hypothetical protein
LVDKKKLKMNVEFLRSLSLIHGQWPVTFYNVGFQVLTAASMKFRVFRDVMPCSHVEFDRRFRGAYCLDNQGDETLVNFNVTTRSYIPEASELN